MATKKTKNRLKAPKTKKRVKRAEAHGRARKAKTRKSAAAKGTATKRVAKKGAPVKAAGKNVAAKRGAGKKHPLVKAAAAAVKSRAPMKAPSTRSRATGAARLPIRRRDGTGHLDPRYAKDLRRHSSPPPYEGMGFLDQPRSQDDLAEVLGETFVETATTGEDEAESMLEQEVPEERGGPFVQSTAGREFAEGTDGSNPKGSKREPFPTT